MGTVSYIHAELRTMYNTVYRDARDEARTLYATATFSQLNQARDELAEVPGTLSVKQRARMRGQLDVIEEMAEAAFLAEPANQVRNS